VTPQAHRDAAVQLLADVNDQPESPSAQRVLTQAAIAHALLGLLEIQLAQASTNERSACGECGETVYRPKGTDTWLHAETQAVRCYRDPHTETAYPDPAFAIERN
jgi:hypothetical protein